MFAKFRKTSCKMVMKWWKIEANLYKFLKYLNDIKQKW